MVKNGNEWADTYSFRKKALERIDKIRLKKANSVTIKLQQ